MALIAVAVRRALLYHVAEMIDLTKIYYFIFGALTIGGGVMGFVKKGSVASIVAGGICGLLLIVAGVLLPEKAQAGLIVGAVISLALAGQFVPKFLATHAWMPAGMMSILSVIGIAMTVLAFAKR